MKSLLESLLNESSENVFEKQVDSQVETEIMNWLKENCGVGGNIKIFQKDGINYVDVRGGHVMLGNHDIERFPTELFRFNRVKTFYCSDCDNLISLEGAPIEIGAEFRCCNCPKLTSLEGGPKKVKGRYYCSGCTSLTSLEGAPEEMKGRFICDRCTSLRTLEGLPDIVQGELDCQECSNLVSLKGAPKEVWGDLNCTSCKKLSNINDLPKYIGGYLQLYNCNSLFAKYSDDELKELVNKKSDIKYELLMKVYNQK